jgi:hypothetical protein
LNFFITALRLVDQVDTAGVGVVGLRHLRGRVLQTHHPGARGRGDRLGDHERVAETMVEPDGDVAGDLDVLALVVADRDLVRVVEHDVGGLQRRIGEQPGRHELVLALGALVLELGHPRQLAVADRALHDPAQLVVLGHVALYEHRRDVGSRPMAKNIAASDIVWLAEHAGLVGDGECVQVDDAVERVAGVLPGDPVAQRPEVVAEVHVAGRLHARQHTCARGRGRIGRRVHGRRRYPVAPVSLR